MSEDLIQKIRNCPKEEMKDLAIELGKTGTKESVDELIRIADGGKYTPEKITYKEKPWYSLKRKEIDRIELEKWEYSLHEQLIAIDALGETKSGVALEYLNNLLEKDEIEEDGIIRWSDDYIIGPRGIVDIEFPNAKGYLKKELHYSFRLGTGTALFYYQDNWQIVAEHNSDKTVKLIEASIAKIRRDLK